jgi:putative tryptophan/tyrosine transport system substrate-binding protein
MRRRDFIQGIVFSAAWWPPAAGAQKPTMPVIGYLAVLRSDSDAHIKVAFGQGLKEAGYIEGRNVAIEFRSAEGHFDRLPDLVTELIGQGVEVIYRRRQRFGYSCQDSNRHDSNCPYWR